jgi:hypothetical protein
MVRDQRARSLGSAGAVAAAGHRAGGEPVGLTSIKALSAAFCPNDQNNLQGGKR